MDISNKESEINCKLKPNKNNKLKQFYNLKQNDKLNYSTIKKRINKIEVKIFKILKLLTQLVTKTIEDQSQETTTSNKVQCASNQGKKDDKYNDETDWSRQLHMHSFEDSLR